MAALESPGGEGKAAVATGVPGIVSNCVLLKRQRVDKREVATRWGIILSLGLRLANCHLLSRRRRENTSRYSQESLVTINSCKL